MQLTHALIVDDSRTSAALLGKMLARSELSSDKVDSGEACLSYLAGTSPDIIFMDHMMPGMDGFEAVKAIKQQPHLAAIPIVMYTSKGGDVYSGQARALGAVGVLQKPAAAQDVADLLQQLGDPAELAVIDPLAEPSNDAMDPAPRVNNARMAAGEAPDLPGWASARDALPNDCRAPRQQLEHALVVDDSRTSAALLAKMLGRHGLDADKVDSGERCLEYLADKRPDVIFMDHMMPGMDGFEAVKAIKRQSRLAAIPIVMYTSKGGEMYIGQARALGAVGVLEKPAAEDALVEIIAELQPRQPEPVVQQIEPPMLDSVADQVVVEEAGSVPSSPAPARENTPYLPVLQGNRTRGQSERFRRRAWLAALLALLLLVGLIWASSGDEKVVDRQDLFESLTQLGNQHQQYTFNSIPFDDQRYDVVREIVRILQLAGLGAQIELRAHVGEFCRVYADTGKAVLPDTALHIEQCDMIGYEPGEAQALASSQSLNFRRFAEKLNRDGGNIRIKLVPVGIFEPIADYPPESEITTAADWNRIAARNQRVELVLRPEPLSLL